MNASQHPLVIAATDYPLHGDAFRTYLSGFYRVETVGHSIWSDGLAEIERYLSHEKPAAVLVDNTFPHEPHVVVRCVKSKQVGCGLIYIDTAPNIFRVLRCLELGFSAYLFLGDQLSDSLKLVIDMARRGERFLSPSTRSVSVQPHLDN